MSIVLFFFVTLTFELSIYHTNRLDEMITSDIFREHCIVQHCYHEALEADVTVHRYSNIANCSTMKQLSPGVR
jgi:hypothetical protein